MGGPTEGTITLPVRSEVTRKFVFRQRITEPKLINSQEPKPGVFVSRTIIDSQQPLLTLINTTNQVMTIRNNDLQIEELSDYNVVDLNEIKNDKNRADTLLNILKQKTPEYCQENLLPLCEEFADVFAIDTDVMTVNNFYTQKLRIKDDTPVYIKNYRTPHALKEEIKYL